MTNTPTLSRPFRRILPALVAVLLTLFGARVLVDWHSPHDLGRAAASRERAIVPSVAPAHAPAARVPSPRPLTLSDVPAPARWARIASSNQFPRLDFTIDLDYFAPLGDGPANAAVWFRDFAKNDGSRFLELNDKTLRLVNLMGLQQKVYPPDHSLLREAEPWVDQATCRFYPDVWEPRGIETPVPNLLLTINLAKSWTFRGEQEKDPERARQDFRRAIRLGRLFMQEDYTLIQHLVGWTCVSCGLQGLNDLARREGDAPMVAATTLALGDYNALRSLAAQWMTDVRLVDGFHRTWWGWSLSIKDWTIDRAIARARSDTLRCLRAEALYPLFVAEHEGTRDQRSKASAALSELAGDRDPRIAALAKRLETLLYDRRESLSMLE